MPPVCNGGAFPSRRNDLPHQSYRHWVTDVSVSVRSWKPYIFVILYSKNGHYTFNLVIKNTYDEQPYLKNIIDTVSNLKEVTEFLEIKSVDGLDRIPWQSIEVACRETFAESEPVIRVCTGKIQFPSLEDRPQIIREYHEMALHQYKTS